MIDFKNYHEIILDFDGVILDSNMIKEKAIKESSEKYLDKKKCDEFVQYFISNNGLPREMKITKYFDEKHSQLVLNDYNSMLNKQLEKASFTKELDSFLDKLNYHNLKPNILSGGDENEINQLLKERNYIDKFEKIMGGPLTKYDNIDNLDLNGKILYIGDSKIDYEVASKYNFDFIFMYGYTQFSEWKDFFKDKNILMSIKDFSVLTNCKC